MQCGLLANAEISTDRPRLLEEQLAEIGIERDDVPRIALLGANG